MSWNFFEIFDIITDVLGLIGNVSSDVSDDKKGKIKKETKYFTEKLSSGLLLVSVVLLFFVFKSPLPPENYVQTLIVVSLIGLAISLILFFILYTLEKYYFKSVFSMAVVQLFCAFTFYFRYFVCLF